VIEVYRLTLAYFKKNLEKHPDFSGFSPELMDWEARGARMTGGDVDVLVRLTVCPLRHA
jgi:hypothetical protein